jgi:o-succinylbenzoate synthase
MHLRRAVLEELDVDLVEPFTTSFGTTRRRRVLFLSLEERGGEVGLAECAAATEPLYSAETIATARAMLEEWFLPLLPTLADPTPAAFTAAAGRWRGHPMARAAVEMALWDLCARRLGTSLARSLGGRRRRVPVGVSVGIQRTDSALVDRVKAYVAAGYGRVKLKVRPGRDARPVGRVRRELPDLSLWVDANQAYGPTLAPALLRWATRHRVEQVEQPFPERAIAAHARLVERAPFRVCLDESVVDRPSLDDAIARRALTSLNVKPGRVGGLGPSIGLARRARSAGIAAWVGGMLETGVGRAHAVALASRSEFTLPADLSASDRYYSSDLIDRPFRLDAGSTLSVPSGPGIGVEVDERRWSRARRRRREIPL